MKCTYWETLVPIFTSLYLPCSECHLKLMQAQGPEAGGRDANKEQEEGRAEGIDWRWEGWAGGTWMLSCGKYTSSGGRGRGGVIYRTGFIKQQTKGQGALRWPSVRDGKCKQMWVFLDTINLFPSLVAPPLPHHLKPPVPSLLCPSLAAASTWDCQQLPNTY